MGAVFYRLVRLLVAGLNFWGSRQEVQFNLSIGFFFVLVVEQGRMVADHPLAIRVPRIIAAAATYGMLRIGISMLSAVPDSRLRCNGRLIIRGRALHSTKTFGWLTSYSHHSRADSRSHERGLVD